MAMRREVSVAGSFYPESAEEIKKYFHYFEELYDTKHQINREEARAVIVPHAGYVYSGYSASIAYRVLKEENIKNILVVGPSHNYSFHGVSLGEYTSYETPLGNIDASGKILELLQKEFQVPFYEEVHKEHSTEVQFPFIKHYFKESKIVELIYSDVASSYLQKIIERVLSFQDCAVVISTDLSHFYNLQEANKLDSLCLRALEELNTELLHKGCEACGKRGVEAMLGSAKNLSLKFHLLDYRTSADVSSDEKRVVGYLSGYFNN